MTYTDKYRLENASVRIVISDNRLDRVEVALRVRREKGPRGVAAVNPDKPVMLEYGMAQLEFIRELGSLSGSQISSILTLVRNRFPHLDIAPSSRAKSSTLGRRL